MLFLVGGVGVQIRVLEFGNVRLFIFVVLSFLVVTIKNYWLKNLVIFGRFRSKDIFCLIIDLQIKNKEDYMDLFV